MFEFDKPVAPTRKKPADRPEGNRHIVLILAVIAVVAGGGAGLYALFSSPQRVLPPQPSSLDTASQKPTPAQPKVEPMPAPVSPSTEVAPVVTSDQRAMDLLEQLRRLVAERNLAALNEISVMSEDRRRILEALFANYSTIEASLGEIVSTPTEVTTVLRIEKLILLNGESIPPGATLRKIRIAIPREGNGWGKIVW